MIRRKKNQQCNDCLKDAPPCLPRSVYDHTIMCTTSQENHSVSDFFQFK